MENNIVSTDLVGIVVGVMKTAAVTDNAAL